jgi:hypothetical protein
MTENKTNFKVDALHAQIQESVTAFADRLLTALGDNLQSITVVGSSLTEDLEAAVKVEAGSREYRIEN